MPYLSRIYLNPLRSGAQALLRNPQRLHAAVLGGLSRQPVDERVLWRIEPDAHRATVLVLTQSTPSWEHIIEQAGWAASDDPQALVGSYQPLLDKIEHGREFRFRLKVNPVSSTQTPQKPTPAQQERLATAARSRGVRIAHRTAEHQLTWLTQKLQKCGFTSPATADGVPDIILGARDRMTFTKPAATGKNRVVIQTATFEGRLRIDNPTLAHHSLITGVGPARAYGCGLLTLAPTCR